MEYNAPSQVYSFEYVKNTHFLRLTDLDGNETKLIEYGLIRYGCEGCKHVWYSEHNVAKWCPWCQSVKITQQWMKPQVALVPEEASDFPLVGAKEG